VQRSSESQELDLPALVSKTFSRGRSTSRLIACLPTQEADGGTGGQVVSDNLVEPPPTRKASRIFVGPAGAFRYVSYPALRGFLKPRALPVVVYSATNGQHTTITNRVALAKPGPPRRCSSRTQPGRQPSHSLAAHPAQRSLPVLAAHRDCRQGADHTAREPLCRPCHGP
jgi:hypothetical protein